MNEGIKIYKPQEHLKEGVKPIIGCIGIPNDFNFDWDTVEQRVMEKQFGNSLGEVHDVDYYSDPDYLKRNNFLNNGYSTYVISPVDDIDKLSTRFLDCTGLVVTGIDKKTGKNISFLSHQDPKEFLSDNKDQFTVHLRQRFAEIKDRCIPSTIDAVIIGGNYITLPKSRSPYKQNYLNSIKLLSLETKQALGFEPSVINGPKQDMGEDKVYYDNENRRLYFIRPKVNPDTGSFVYSDIEEEKKRWKKR